MTVAIIGGGIAGLASAFHIVERGGRPVLFEPDELGGMIQTRVHDGFTLEQGPNVLVERPDIANLVKALGLSAEVMYPRIEPYGQYVWYRNSPCKVPASVSEAIGSPLISVVEKFLLPYRLCKPGLLKPAQDDLSVLEFFEPLLGEHTTRCLLDPVLKGIYGGDVGDLSARTLFPGLWKMGVEGRSVLNYLKSKPRGAKPRIFVLRGGMQRLVQSLTEAMKGKIEIVRDRVSSVRRREEGFVIETSSGMERSVAGCVVTTAGAVTSSFMRSIGPEISSSLEALRFAGLTVAHFAVNKTQRLIEDSFGVLCPGGMPENFLGVMFNSILFPHVAPPNKHLLTVVLGGAQAGESLPSEGEIRSRIPQLLDSMFAVKEAEWLGAFSWRKAIPQLSVGHYHLVELLNACERANPGLVFVGVDRGGVGVSDRLRVAREGVEKLGSAHVLKEP